MNRVRTLLRDAGFEAEPSAIVVQGLNPAPHSKLLYFVFFDGQSEPSVVAKRIRNPVLVEHLVREYENVALAFRGLGEGTLRVPEALGLDGESGLYLQTVIAGESMFQKIRRHGHRLTVQEVKVFFSKALEVESKVADVSDSCGPTVVHSGSDTWRTLLEQAISIHTLSPEESALLKEEEQALGRALRGGKLKLTPQHGDFWAGNLFVDGSNRWLLDWEWWGWVDLPGFDIAFVLVTTARRLKLGKASWAKFDWDASWASNLGDSRADVWELVELAKGALAERFGLPGSEASRYLGSLLTVCPAMLSVRDYGISGQVSPADVEWLAYFRNLAAQSRSSRSD